MGKVRKIHKVLKSKPTIEGAGVHLKRAFGFHEVSMFDPFLLLDDLRSDNPEDYIMGFPWHPHRGIETITYVLRGEVEHGDSMGNKGIISSGDLQWMTAALFLRRIINIATCERIHLLILNLKLDLQSIGCQNDRL